MRLRGLHAQGVTTMQDGLAKLGAGKLSEADFNQLTKLLEKQQKRVQLAVAAPQNMVKTILPVEPE